MKKGHPHVAPLAGWFLVCPDELSKNGSWYVAWHGQFDTKKSALAFANDNGWTKPFKAMRGAISIAPSLKTSKQT